MSIEHISQIILEDNFDPEKFIVPALPKEKDTRGFIYVVIDTKYTDLIKVGKTQDFVKRVKQYNVDRPFEDVLPVLCTRLLKNCDYVEKHIKNELIRKYNSVGKSQEWFHKDSLEDVYKILENEFDIQYTSFGDSKVS